MNDFYTKFDLTHIDYYDVKKHKDLNLSCGIIEDIDIMRQKLKYNSDILINEIYLLTQLKTEEANLDKFIVDLKVPMDDYSVNQAIDILNEICTESFNITFTDSICMLESLDNIKEEIRNKRLVKIF